MKTKKIMILGIIVLSVILFTSLISSADVCCEKLNNNFCKMAPKIDCDTGINPITGTPYKTAPTACKSTSADDFCGWGTCINSDGICMKNTPKATCDNSGGIFDKRDKEDIPQCRSGCCVYEDQVSFTTKSKCKAIGTDVGIETTFIESVGSESECLGYSSPKVEGACVIEIEESIKCTRTKKEDCPATDDFYDGKLCTDPELNTDCAPSDLRKCEENGKIYFLDTCGNKANVYDEVYDPKKVETTGNVYQEYWSIIKETGLCVATPGSGDCGNCNYYDVSEGSSVCDQTKAGKYICRNLDCINSEDDFLQERLDEYKTRYGSYPRHGESWCSEIEGVSYILNSDSEGTIDESKSKVGDQETTDLPGSRHYRFLCSQGEIISDPCAIGRQEICKEKIMEDTEDFILAGCIKNRYEDCYTITDKTKCEDSYSRDCKWISGTYIILHDPAKVFEEPSDTGACVPLFAPGFDFWEESSGASMCKLGGATLSITYETSIWKNRDKWGTYTWDTKKTHCAEGCYGIPEFNAVDDSRENNWKKDGGNHEKWNDMGIDEHSDWLSAISEVCRSMGDCGYKPNYLDKKGIASSEIVNAMFMKLSQKGDIKTDEPSIKKVYDGASIDAKLGTGEEEYYGQHN